MMTFTEIKKQMDNDSKDTRELEAMLAGFEGAKGFRDLEFYKNQLYGFVCGLAAIHYITPNDVDEIMNNLDFGTL